MLHSRETSVLSKSRKTVVKRCLKPALTNFAACHISLQKVALSPPLVSPSHAFTPLKPQGSAPYIKLIILKYTYHHSSFSFAACKWPLQAHPSAPSASAALPPTHLHKPFPTSHHSISLHLNSRKVFTLSLIPPQQAPPSWPTSKILPWPNLAPTPPMKRLARTHHQPTLQPSLLSLLALPQHLAKSSMPS